MTSPAQKHIRHHRLICDCWQLTRIGSTSKVLTHIWQLEDTLMQAVPSAKSHTIATHSLDSGNLHHTTTYGCETCMMLRSMLKSNITQVMTAAPAWRSAVCCDMVIHMTQVMSAAPAWCYGVCRNLVLYMTQVMTAAPAWCYAVWSVQRPAAAVCAAAVQTSP